jgi:hypothetical protein
VKAEGFVAVLAIEMNMYVLVKVVTMTATELITHTVAAVLNDVNQVVLTKKGECSEYARLVYRQDGGL